MLKYAGVAAASKLFSATAPGRRLYRRLGNVALERMRVADGLPQRYLDRAERLLTLVETHRVLDVSDRAVELGTGWVHWEATVLALHHDVQVTLFDVTDNRLFGAWRAYLAQYRDHLAAAPADAPGNPGRAVERADAALRARDFAEAYAALGFTHVIHPTGDLTGLGGDHGLVVSADVLEHVHAAVLPDHLRQEFDLLAPGGHAIHQIDLVDHYHYFDPTMSPKHFYRYDDVTWQRWFDNDVQYVNRVQRPQWQQLFLGAGFEVVEDDLTSDPAAVPPALARPFADLDPVDLACLQMLTVHRRPA